jgi:hypothetical protein
LFQVSSQRRRNSTGSLLPRFGPGRGCDCLSQVDSVSLCPAIPRDDAVRSCAEQEAGDVCCALHQQQLNVSFSGREEVTRVSSPGASIECYQPTQEPAQILCYPSSTLLLEARKPGAQELASFDPFTIAGGVYSNRTLWRRKDTYLFNGRNLAVVFRAKLLAAMRASPNIAVRRERRHFSVGATPTRQLSFRPVAIGTVVEVTKQSELPV